MKYTSVITISLLLGLAVNELNAQLTSEKVQNSLYQRKEREIQERALRGEVDGSGSGSSGKAKTTSILEASWIAVEEPSIKGIHVHDLVSIVISEKSKHSTKAETETEKEYTLDMALTEWIRLTGGNLRPDKQKRGDPKIKAALSREFEAEGDIKREDTLTAQIQAEVVDVYPNGSLLLEATHTVMTDDETTVIILTGRCRSKDIGVDNTIISSKVANLVVKKHHTGIIRDATKRGFLVRLVDFINPF